MTSRTTVTMTMTAIIRWVGESFKWLLAVLIDAVIHIKDSLARMASSVAFGNQSFIHLKLSRPLSDCHRLSIKCQSDAAAPIIGLGCSCSPLAVVRFVMSIVVEPFKGVPIWRDAHVEEKVFKLTPSFANANSSATVVLECAICRIAAAIFHVSPCFVGWCFAHAVSLAASGSDFFSKASTGFCRPVTQRTCRRFNYSSAIAPADPSRAAALWISGKLLRRDKPTKSIADVYKMLHAAKDNK